MACLRTTLSIIVVILVVKGGTGKRPKKPKCKHQGKKFSIGKIIETNDSYDGCAKAILPCIKVGKKAKIILQAKNECQAASPECLISEDMGKTGILIVGGKRSGPDPSDFEIFLPSTGTTKTCCLKLPEGRYEHTLNIVQNKTVVCGGITPPGFTKQDSCISYNEGEWLEYGSPLTMTRVEHSSWVTGDGQLLLLGGRNTASTERIPLNGGNSVQGFDLKYRTGMACSITDFDSIILTGGYGDDDTDIAVTRYNILGHVEDLPNLLVGRWGHGCGSYNQGDGTQVLIVAGGSGRDDNLDSTEKLVVLPGNRWTNSSPLPRPLYLMASVSMDNTIFLIGGMEQSGVINAKKEILAFVDGDKWVKAGILQKGRIHLGATIIDIDSDILKHCK